MAEAPPARNGLLGRAADLAELGGLLGRFRLITVTGAPGVGKTRLAREYAVGQADRAVFVDLAPVSDPALVTATLAFAVAVREVPGQTMIESVIGCLQRERSLLVLDNCDRLTGACRGLVDALLTGCPELSIVATSRAPLRAEGERVWPLAPLAVPERGEPALPEVLMECPSVRLFVERAGRQHAGFRLSSYVAPAVAELCRRLDGIPLAIELAAARVDMLTPAEIAQRLDARFDLLAGGNDADGRHETLEAALDLSYELLSGRERALLRRLSVFNGGFDLVAAAALCADDEVKASAVRELLASLVSKSLVAVDTGSAPEARYRLLETVRAYASDRLEHASEAALLREGHARFYLELTEALEPELTGPRQALVLQSVDREWENLRRALEWSLGHARGEWALRMAGALVLFWRVRCRFSEGRDLLLAALSADDNEAPALRAKALWGAGFMALMAGDPQGAVPSLEQSLAVFREQSDLQGAARALLILGNCIQFLAGEDPLTLLEKSAALAREADDGWCLAHALGVAGFENASHGELPRARVLFEQSLATARNEEDKQGLRIGLIGLGSVALQQGEYGSAQTLLEEALAIGYELDEDYGKAEALHYLGWLALEKGEHGKAGELLTEALALVPEPAPSGTALGMRVLLAKLAHAAGDSTVARARFERVLAEAGTDPPISALLAKGDLALEMGEVEGCRQLLEAALGRARGWADKDSVAQALHRLGRLARREGDFCEAATLHRQALELEREVGATPGIIDSLEAVAGLAAVAGDEQRAAVLMGAASMHRQANGYARVPWEAAGYEADLARIRAAIAAADFEKAFLDGGELSIEDAATLALKCAVRNGRESTGWHSLTERQKQVAQLAAEGLTNPEIADRLVITRSTVKRHLWHIFSRLGVARRSELARVMRRDDESQAAPKTT